MRIGRNKNAQIVKELCYNVHTCSKRSRDISEYRKFKLTKSTNAFKSLPSYARHLRYRALCNYMLRMISPKATNYFNPQRYDNSIPKLSTSPSTSVVDHPVVNAVLES